MSGWVRVRMRGDLFTLIHPPIYPVGYYRVKFFDSETNSDSKRFLLCDSDSDSDFHSENFYLLTLIPTPRNSEIFNSTFAMPKQQRIGHKDHCIILDDIKNFFDDCRYVFRLFDFSNVITIKGGQFIFALNFFINLCNRQCLQWQMYQAQAKCTEHLLLLIYTLLYTCS